MITPRRIKRALRGGVGARAVMLEGIRRARAALARRRERALIARAEGARTAARLAHEFARLDSTELLRHFRARNYPRLFTLTEGAEVLRESFPAEAAHIVERAERITREHRWPLLGFGELDFGKKIDWLRDPVSGTAWPLEYHADVQLVRGDGADVRVLWELNRLGHLVTLAQGYALTREVSFADEFFAQLDDWRAQNPLGRGPNWACAMEAALRALNLLAAFELLRGSEELEEARLGALLAVFDEHGAHIERNLEFSHVATSNHYLSDVAGLFWLGLCLPELAAARRWREWACAEMLREMDKQVLPDGADFEASTGYHRFVTEIFLYSFILARANGIEIDERRREKLRAMLSYTRAYLRPDGRAPLLGDADGTHALHISERAADDHAYLLAVGAVVFDDPSLKISDEAAQELSWLLGRRGVETFARLSCVTPTRSEAFRHAGTYVMREGDLYLLCNASGAGVHGRGSHAHNDALSLEVSCCGASLLADPGTYVYTADLRARQQFRSTAYHTTVEVDGDEQNRTDERTPFVIGDEARPRLLRWETNEERDLLTAEHYGYMRLREPVTHRRTVLFDKRARLWLVEDILSGKGLHAFRFRFHAAPEVDVQAHDGRSLVELKDQATGARLLVAPLAAPHGFELSIEQLWSSRGYGQKTESLSACWTVRAQVPARALWALLPACTDEDTDACLQLIERLRAEYINKPLAISAD